MNIADYWRVYRLREELRKLLNEDHNMRFPTGQTTSVAVDRLVEIGKRVWEIRHEIHRIESK